MCNPPGRTPHIPERWAKRVRNHDRAGSGPRARKVARLLELIGWSGVFQAQFIHSEDEKYLIDFNPRIYGSVALAVGAGVNIPAIWVELLLGRNPAVHDYRPGVHYRAFERDARAVLSLLAGGHLISALRAMIPRPGIVRAVLSLRDPLPMLTSIEKLTGIMWRKALRRSVSSRADR